MRLILIDLINVKLWNVNVIAKIFTEKHFEKFFLIINGNV